jgi:hypothetical protein
MKQAKEDGRFILLNNDRYWLGALYDESRFVHWIQEIEPDAYVLPDVPFDWQATAHMADAFLNKYSHLPGQPMGVVQGSNFKEIEYCYAYLSIRVNYIGFSFSAPPPLRLFKEKLVWRYHYVKHLVDSQTIDPSKSHHLLGLYAPQEVALYKEWPWITSLDTCNPVLHGLLGQHYILDPQTGLYYLCHKSCVRLYSLVEEPFFTMPWTAIWHNTNGLRRNLRNFKEAGVEKVANLCCPTRERLV